MEPLLASAEAIFSLIGIAAIGNQKGGHAETQHVSAWPLPSVYIYFVIRL